MKIVYLHGFRSGANSKKISQLKKMFPEHDVIGLEYSPHDPMEALYSINLFHFENTDEELLFVGTSLGGFWSIVAAGITNSKFIVINPSVEPHITLKPGTYSVYGHEDDESKNITVTYDNIKYFERLVNQLKLNAKPNGIFVLATDDDVIDLDKVREYANGQELIEFDNQGHQFKDMSVLKNIINNLINTYTI